MRRRTLTEIHDRPFDEPDLSDDPLALFTRWFEEAKAHGAFEPDAVALATATPEGAPSARMVLMKGFDERGLSFFTNYASRKGGELEANPHAALVFHWPEVGRQVRIDFDTGHYAFCKIAGRPGEGSLKRRIGVTVPVECGGAP